MRKLTPVDVALQVIGNPMAGIVELQMQAQPQEGGVLFDELGDFHFDFVAQHGGTLAQRERERGDTRH